MKFSLTAFVFLVAIAAESHAQFTVESVNIGRGNVPLYLPSSYDASEPLPLIVGLHGYSGSGPGLEAYFDFTYQIEAERFLYLVPEGTRGANNLRFWNATEACCGGGVDDSAYLRALVDQVRDDYAVDVRSIHFAGHSNGGFMSHRMAIDHADIVASITSLAGANYIDAAAHNPSEPVHVLQVHGTADSVIRYNGGFAFAPYPGAEQTVLNWVDYNGLQPVAETVGAAFNMDLSVPGDETTSQVYDLNNDLGITVELWTLAGSGHAPSFGNGINNLFGSRTVDWLLSHRKPSGCDFDFDGNCSLADIDMLYNQLFHGFDNRLFDLNGDELVSNDDIEDWLLLAGAEHGKVYRPGDVNLDGAVLGGDFTAFAVNFGTSVANPADGGRWSDGNFTGIGLNGQFTVAGEDFSLLASNFGQVSGATAIPEPGCLVLIVSFTVGLVLPWRRHARG